MEVRREQSEIVDRTKYNEIKTDLYINSEKYTRECNFAREITLGNDRDGEYREGEEEKVVFSLWMNRNNYNEILLSEKYYSNGIVNYSGTRLTRFQAMHIIHGDLTYMENSDNLIIQQLFLYIKYNQFKMISFREYFEENYFNVYNSDILNIKSMELYIANDMTEFFSEQLKPVVDINYNRIEVNMIQKIEVPSVILA